MPQVVAGEQPHPLMNVQLAADAAVCRITCYAVAMGRDFNQVLASVRIGELPRRPVCRVEPSTPLGEVYRRLDEEQAVAVLVCEGSKLLGIFTERDVLYRTALEGDPETPVGDLMTRDPITLSGDEKLAEAIRTMAEKGFRHVPVWSGEGDEAGLIGGRDVLEMIAEYFPETLLHLPPRLHQKMLTPEGA